MSRTIGLIAGMGRLPELLAASAARRGDAVVVIRALPGAFATPGVPHSAACDIFLGDWHRVVETLKAHRVERVYLAGKISREYLLAGAAVDERFQRVLATAKGLNDDEIIAAFVSDLEREGMPVGEQFDYLAHLRCRPGLLTPGAVTAREWRDIERGYAVAKALAGLDVGQTAVVKEGAVVAVEAVEGTDQAIERGGRLARGGAVVVKVAKPAQDLRFDLPTVGLETLKSMARHGATLLAFEAELTLLLEREEMVAFATERGIKLVSYTPGLEERRSA